MVIVLLLTSVSDSPYKRFMYTLFLEHRSYAFIKGSNYYSLSYVLFFTY